jgi:cytochrome c553
MSRRIVGFYSLVWLMPLLVLAKDTARSDLAIALNSSPDLGRGEWLFTQCVQCHGVRGGGDTSGSTPRIAGQHYEVIIKQLVDFRYGTRWNFRMEERAGRHYLATAKDIADVAAYVSKLDYAGDQGIGSGEYTTQGALIYGKHCQSCHGAGAYGDAGRGIPRLAGQHYGYLVRQMYDAADGRRPALPGVHAKRIAPLDFNEVRAVADYISRVGATSAHDLNRPQDYVPGDGLKWQ